ncbi:MAG TPA: DUF1003 domain-containing protein [Clostridia bacterium]
MKHPNETHKEGLSKQEKIGLKLGALMGTMYTFYILAVINLGWMLWQSDFMKKPFDPYPFAFLLFCSNIIQLLWLPILNVNGNVLNKHAEIKADADYELDKQTLAEIEELHRKIDLLYDRSHPTTNI